jgi:hypothetical protein
MSKKCRAVAASGVMVVAPLSPVQAGKQSKKPAASSIPRWCLNAPTAYAANIWSAARK